MNIWFLYLLVMSSRFLKVAKEFSSKLFFGGLVSYIVAILFVPPTHFYGTTLSFIGLAFIGISILFGLIALLLPNFTQFITIIAISKLTEQGAVEFTMQKIGDAYDEAKKIFNKFVED